MFRIDPNPQFTVPVEIRVPGVEEPQSIDVTFRAMSYSEQDGFDMNTRDGTDVYLKRAVVTITGLVDDDGREVGCSPELFDRLIDLPWVRVELIRAHLKHNTGIARGN